MKFRNESSMTGFTKFKVVGLLLERHQIGIHRIGPIKTWDIDDAIDQACRDGFNTIYIHTTSPDNVKKLIRKILTSIEQE